MVRRVVGSLVFSATALMLSCAANPNAPSPIKEDPPAAFEFRAPHTTLTDDFGDYRQAGATDAPA